MGDTFIVTGLPRSRTGWLANLFTYGSSFCFHDGLQYGKDTIIRKMANLVMTYKHVGNSDSGACWAWSPADLPFDKIIIVRRNKAEAEASFMQYFTRHPYPQQKGVPPNEAEVKDIFAQFEKRLADCITCTPRDKIRVVSFGDLDQVDVCEYLWNFICPGERFNRERWEVLDKLRVNPASEKVQIVWES